MRMRVEIKGRGEQREVEMDSGATVWDLLKELKISRETVVVFMDGRVVPEEEPLREGAQITILPVVTGG